MSILISIAANQYSNWVLSFSINYHCSLFRNPIRPSQYIEECRIMQDSMKIVPHTTTHGRLHRRRLDIRPVAASSFSYHPFRHEFHIGTTPLISGVTSPFYLLSFLIQCHLIRICLSIARSIRYLLYLCNSERVSNPFMLHQ